MYQQTVTGLILRQFREYISNIEADFQLGLWGGDVVLNDLELKLDVLNKKLGIDSPFSISKGSIKELKVKIAWSSITSTPVEIVLSSVDIHLSNNNPNTTSSVSLNINNHNNPYQHINKKHNKLNESDGAKSVDHTSINNDPLNPINPNINIQQQDNKHNDDDNKNNDDPQFQQQQESSTGASFVSSLLMRILGNASITINDLTIKYIDHNCKCEATLKIQQFQTFATTLNWQQRPEVYDFLTPWKLMHRSSSFKNVSLFLGLYCLYC